MRKLHILATTGTLLLAATGASFAANPDGLVNDPQVQASQATMSNGANGVSISQPRIYNRGLNTPAPAPDRPYGNPDRW